MNIIELFHLCRKKIQRLIVPNKVLGPHSQKGGWPAQKSLPGVDVLIDVGIGHQGTEGLYNNINPTSFVFIDPIIECKKTIQHYLDSNKSNIFLDIALGDKRSKQVINVATNMISQSSFDKVLPSRTGEEQKIEKRVVRVKELDKVEDVRKAISGKTYGIKLDVEGHEALAIKGGYETISQAEFVILEMPVGNKRYDRELEFHQYIAIMVQLGFRVHSIRMGKGGGQGHCDVAFQRSQKSKKT